MSTSGINFAIDDLLKNKLTTTEIQRIKHSTNFELLLKLAWFNSLLDRYYGWVSEADSYKILGKIWKMLNTLKKYEKI